MIGEAGTGIIKADTGVITYSVNPLDLMIAFFLVILVEVSLAYFIINKSDLKEILYVFFSVNLVTSLIGIPLAFSEPFPGPEGVFLQPFLLFFLLTFVVESGLIYWSFRLKKGSIDLSFGKSTMVSFLVNVSSYALLAGLIASGPALSIWVQEESYGSSPSPPSANLSVDQSYDDNVATRLEISHQYGDSLSKNKTEINFEAYLGGDNNPEESEFVVGTVKNLENSTIEWKIEPESTSVDVSSYGELSAGKALSLIFTVGSPEKYFEATEISVIDGPSEAAVLLQISPPDIPD